MLIILLCAGECSSAIFRAYFVMGHMDALWARQEDANDSLVLLFPLVLCCTRVRGLEFTNYAIARFGNLYTIAHSELRRIIGLRQGDDEISVGS